MITNKELTDILLAYHAGNITKPLFRECIYKIAKEASQHLKYQFEDDVLQEATDLCVEKEGEIDEKRGNTMMYFITIMCCYFKQVSRKKAPLN